MRLSWRGRGPLVVKLAGAAGGVGLYRAEIDHAIAHGFRVAAVDTTGDRADDPVSSRLTWDSLADEVAAAVERLGGPAVLWGTSFGSIVALATAARHGERVAGLLLCHPPDPENRPRLQTAFLNWMTRGRNPERHAARLFRTAFVVLNGWELLAPRVLARLPELGREAMACATPGSTVLGKLDLLWNGDVGQPGPGLPASVVAGRWDGIAPLSGARRLAQRLPGARLRVIGFSGHAGAYSRAPTYHRIVVEELRRITGVETGPVDGTGQRVSTRSG